MTYGLLSSLGEFFLGVGLAVLVLGSSGAFVMWLGQ
jgi:hypothetical protein